MTPRRKQALIGIGLALAVSVVSCAQAQASTRHHRGIPWCGMWMSKYVYHKDIRRLWIARNWKNEGRPAPGPAPHLIGVEPHHVFMVIRVVAPGRVLAISGNDGGRVRTRIRSTRKVIAWREV